MSYEYWDSTQVHYRRKADRLAAWSVLAMVLLLPLGIAVICSLLGVLPKETLMVWQALSCITLLAAYWLKCFQVRALESAQFQKPKQSVDGKPDPAS